MHMITTVDTREATWVCRQGKEANENNVSQLKKKKVLKNQIYTFHRYYMVK